MSNITILGRFNNYYNRILKRYDTLTEYINNAQNSKTYTNINFATKDGVNTVYTINFGELETPFEPDYIVATDKNGAIENRWFVIEANKQNKLQYTMTLRRDLGADFYDIMVGAPAFIEKATPAINSPLIFNGENMTFNEIKRNETLLKDKTGCAWLYGYIGKDRTTQTVNISIPVGNYDFIIDDFESWSQFKYTNLYVGTREYGLVGISNIRAKLGHKKETAIPIYHWIKLPNKTIQRVYSSIKSNVVTDDIDEDTVANNLNQNFNQNTLAYAVTADNDFDSSLDGKVLYNRDDSKYYAIKYYRVSQGTIEKEYTGGTVGDYLETVIANAGYECENDTFTVEMNATAYAVELTEATQPAITFTVNLTNANTRDAVYDVFCIPLTLSRETRELFKLGFTESSIYGVHYYDTYWAVDVMQQIKKALSSFCYDIQLLPYGPYQDIYQSRELDTWIDADQLTSTDYTVIDATLPIFFPHKSKVEFNIEYNIEQGETTEDRKVNTLTKKYRICSPNYASMFELDAEQNGGVKFFNVDMMFRPTQPYIHINPDFGLMYGEDYNDARGLILSGDFSLPYINDTMIDYETQNKYYREMFDREIDNIKVNNSIQMTNQIFSAIGGAVQGGAMGAQAGANIGGSTGAIVGGIVGGATAVAGGIADTVMLAKLQEENLDFKQDMFGFNLQTIKARPNTVAKLFAFTNNNKIFPVLEEYGCTDVEEQALRMKLRYNGYTIGVIGTIEEYIKTERTYIKGKFIRLENIPAEYHEVLELGAEFNKGWYM